ncbi:MAG: acyltransferase [Solirubrobacterales bacterium]
MRRLLVVDALRAVAAISVLLHHLPAFTGPLIILRPWQAIGFIGVGLFLVLSGFSIHYRWAATRHDGAFDQRVFWRRRFFRLVPTYWAGAALAVVTAIALGNLDQPAAPWGEGTVPWSLAWATQILVVSANFIPVPALFVTWTIALEVQLYAAYALVVRFVRRFDPLKITLWALGVALAWRVGSQLIITSVPAGGFLPDGNSPLESRILYGQMPARCFEWFLGMLAAEAYLGNVKLPRWTRSVTLAGFLLLVTGGIQREPQIPLTLAGNQFMLTDVFFDLVVGVAFFALLNWAISREDSRLMRAGGERPLRFAAYLGFFSYSIYLVHDTFIQVWNRYLGTTNNALILVEAVAAIAVSWLFFLIVERRYIAKR